MDDRECSNCNRSMSFQEFQRNNPQMTFERAIGFWKDRFIAPVCPECFFSAQERPFKRNRNRCLAEKYKRLKLMRLRYRI